MTDKELKPLIVFNRYLDRKHIGDIKNVAELASCVESDFSRMKDPMKVQIIVQEAPWLQVKAQRRAK